MYWLRHSGVNTAESLSVNLIFFSINNDVWKYYYFLSDNMKTLFFNIEWFQKLFKSLYESFINKVLFQSLSDDDDKIVHYLNKKHGKQICQLLKYF